jgi:hypothetical protein
MVGFNWSEEFKNPVRDIYKLTIAGNSKIIQGLVSLEVKSDHVYMHLVENAPFNKVKLKFMLVLLVQLHMLVNYLSTWTRWKCFFFRNHN